MSETNSGMDTQSLLLSLLQRMQINSSSSSSFTTENNQDRQQSLQGGDSVIINNLEESLPLAVDWDPTSGIPRWEKRQALPPPDHLDALIHNCQEGKENETPETLSTQGPLGARLGNSVPSTMLEHNPKRDNQHRLANLVGDKTRWNTGSSFGTSVILRDPVWMSPWGMGAGPPPRLEQEQDGAREGGEILSPGPCRDISDQNSTDASNPTGPLEKSTSGLPLNPQQWTDASQEDSTVGDPITSPSALKQTRNPTAATDILNPVDTSGGSNSGTQNMVARHPPLGPNFEWGGKGDFGGAPGVVEWDDTKGSLRPHQNVWENTTTKMKRRRTGQKTATWTERIKDRWRDRPKSLGKNKVGQRSGPDGKVRERGKEEKEKSQQSSHLTWHRIMDKNISDAPTKEEEFISQSPIREWPNHAPPTQAQRRTESHMSTFNELECSFPPTNLMEDIFTGEEWPNSQSVRRSPFTIETTSQSATGGDCVTHPNQNNNQPEMSEMQTIPFEFWSTDSQWDIVPGDNHIMDRNTMKLYTNTQPAANKKSIEHMLIQSMASSVSCRSYQVQARDQSRECISEASSKIFTKPVEVLDYSVQMSHVHSNRKREHSSGTRNSRGPMRGLGGRVEPGEGDSTVNTHLQTAEGTNEEKVNTISLYDFQDSSMPLPPRSTFQSSAVHDSESSTSSETVIKKRKMADGREDTRHVRFAEQPVFLPDLQPFEIITPKQSNKSGLQAWILALKGKTKRKSQH
ncbi:uncharacterized protein LOC133134661 isoform X1 [Conger conger]|uniref:uncharacterized protein LOC133134661 isoform X1 n=2 Tax=Conger conger TaxID=82655 RepID=UPI002A59A967|nr:uncharacterized protein LOC133134661 isoform X1 [Conger conger]